MTIEKGTPVKAINPEIMGSVVSVCHNPIKKEDFVIIRDSEGRLHKRNLSEVEALEAVANGK